MREHSKKIKYYSRHGYCVDKYGCITDIKIEKEDVIQLIDKGYKIEIQSKEQNVRKCAVYEIDLNEFKFEDMISRMSRIGLEPVKDKYSLISVSSISDSMTIRTFDDVEAKRTVGYKVIKGHKLNDMTIEYINTIVRKEIADRLAGMHDTRYYTGQMQGWVEVNHE